MQKSHYLGFPSEGGMSLSPKELMDFGTDGNWEVTTTWLGPHNHPNAAGMKTKV